MGKQLWKPGNMLYPLPVVMVSLADPGRPPQYYHAGLGRNRMYQSAHGVDLRTPREIFLSDPKGERRIRDQSDHEGAGICHQITVA